MEFVNTRYTSYAGMAAIESVLNSTALLDYIYEHAPIPVRCPAQWGDADRASILELPQSDWLALNSNTVVLFEACALNHDEHVAAIIVTHLPTQSWVGIDIGSSELQRLSFGAPSGHAHLSELLSDAKLLRQLWALAPRESRCAA